MIKKYPESIILLILYGIGINTLIIGLTTNYNLNWQHFAGFIILLLTTLLYFRIHKRFIEILLILGLLNLINLNVSTLTFIFSITLGSSKLNTFGIQPIFLLATIAYVIINRRWIFPQNEPTEEEKKDIVQKYKDLWKVKFSKKTESELRNIVENKNKYQPDAVTAAEELLNQKNGS